MGASLAFGGLPVFEAGEVEAGEPVGDGELGGVGARPQSGIGREGGHGLLEFTETKHTATGW